MEANWRCQQRDKIYRHYCLSTHSSAFVPSGLVHARDVPLHHKASLLKSAATAPQSSTPDLLGRNTSEDGPNNGDNNINYYDYDGLDEESPSVTAPDVIYPNPDRLPRKPAVVPSSSSVEFEAQEIKSSNFVLRGISTNSQTGGNGQVVAPGAPPPPGAAAAAGTMNNNRVLVRPNEVVDYELVEALDQDFKGHDLIDSIMYIYYGANSGSALGKEVGGNIIVIGAVVALAAQLLTIIILFMKHRHSRQKNVLFPVLTALLAMTFLANFLFIVGVQSSRNAFKCEIIAILLHYLHLSTTFWVFLYIYCVHQFIKNNAGPNLNLLLSFGVCMPALYIVLNYLMDTSNYEVANYCWMSVKKGMIFNYMIPISFFIVATAVYGTMCLRLLRNKQRQQFTESIESFIEHSRSEQMLNQIRQIGPECPQQGPPTAALSGVHRAVHGGSHRRLARCHSNPSSTTLKKSTAHLRAAANLTTSSINLTSTSNSIGSPTKEPMTPTQQQQPEQYPPPCCSAMLLQNMVPQNMPHCLDMMGTSKSICGESKYSLGSISLANLSIQSLSSETEDFEEYKSAVKFAILFQIMFSICWFLAVIALEYPTSMMPIIYVIVLNIVNWILLAKCQAICPTMVISPLSAVTATESHANSFSKKSVKSIKSQSGENHHQQQQQHPPLQTTAVQQQPTEKMVPSSGRNHRNGSLRSNCCEEKPMAIPFDDPVSGVGKGNHKKKDSVSSMDTIPLLAKSAGLRTDTMIANATITDNLDNGADETLVENGVGDRSPTLTASDPKLSSHILGNGHATATMWSSSTNGGGHIGLDALTHRTEFISTIST